MQVQIRRAKEGFVVDTFQLRDGRMQWLPVANFGPNAGMALVFSRQIEDVAMKRRRLYKGRQLYDEPKMVERLYQLASDYDAGIRHTLIDGVLSKF